MVVTVVAVGTKSTRGEDAHRPRLRLVTVTVTAPFKALDPEDDTVFLAPLVDLKNALRLLLEEQDV